MQKYSQIPLESVETVQAFIRRNPIERVKTFGFDEGFSAIGLMSNNKPKKIFGFDVNKKSRRLSLFGNGHLFCACCGLEGKTWYLERDRRDPRGQFTINLYGTKSTPEGIREVALTWDHIIPKSMGGNDSLNNAQTLCHDCNTKKANNISLSEIEKFDRIGRLRLMISSVGHKHELAAYVHRVGLTSINSVKESTNV